MNPNLCKHFQNPIACLFCFQEKQRAPQKTRQDPEAKADARGAVVPFERAAVANPHLAMLQAKKDQMFADMQANMAKLPPRQEVVEEAAEPPHRHRKHRHRHREEEQADAAPEEQADAAPEELDDATVRTLESMYPKHKSVIDNLPTHPDSVQPQGARLGGRGRVLITKGRPVGS